MTASPQRREERGRSSSAGGGSTFGGGVDKSGQRQYLEDVNQRASRRDRQILSSLWLLMFAASSQVMVVAPLLSSIGEQLGVATSTLGNLMTVYATAVGVFALIAGPVSDRVGRRRVILCGSVLMTLALALHGVARDYASLLWFRGIAGVAGGLLSGAVVAFIGDSFPSERRGWANGWIMTGFAAGQILGVPLGVVLGAATDYRTPFVVLAAVCALATVCAAIFLPQVPTRADRLTLLSILGGYLALLRRPSTSAAAATYAAVFFGIAAFMVFLPVWLESGLGFTAASVAVLYLVGGFGTVYAGPRAGALSDRIGRKTVILWASVGLIVTSLLMPVGVGFATFVAFPAFLAVNVFLSARASAFQAMLTELVGTHERGSLMSLTTAAGQLGFASGAAAAGPTFASLGFDGNAALTAVAAALAAAFVWKFIPDPKPENLHAEAECPCNSLQIQPGLCGPTPESGHMAGALQALCAAKRVS